MLVLTTLLPAEKTTDEKIPMATNVRSYLVSSIWVLVRVIFFCQFPVCLRVHTQVAFRKEGFVNCYHWRDIVISDAMCLDDETRTTLPVAATFFNMLDRRRQFLNVLKSEFTFSQNGS